MTTTSRKPPHLYTEYHDGAPAELVSIIVPAYNRGKYIEQCVRSALAQTHRAIELLIVDDGSTDDTAQRLQDLAVEDARIRLLYHPGGANRGQAASINLGLKHARGEFINILDSDDFFAREKLARQLNYLRNHPDMGLVYSNGYLTDEHGNPMHSYHSPGHHDPGSADAVLLDCYLALPVNALVARSVYRHVGLFEETFRAAQDHDMVVRMAECTRFGYITDHLFYYRRHSDSISSKQQEVRWRVGFEILRRASKRYPYRRATLRKRRAVLHYRMGEVYWRRGDRLWALPHFARSGALDPVRALRVVLGKEQAR